MKKHGGWKLKQLIRKFAPMLFTGITSIFLMIFLIEAVVYFKPEIIPSVIRTEYFMSGAENYPPGTIPDDEVGYKFAPNVAKLVVPFGDKSYTISTTSLGYNDVGFRDDGIADKPFAVVVGDSVTVCVGVNQENCWVELLEQKTGKDFANLGVSGYGPDLQLRMLHRYGLPLNPELVIWAFFANDMIQVWRFEQFGQGATAEGQFWKHPVRAWLAKHSSIYLTLAYFWYERNFFRHYYSDNPAVAGNATLAWWLAYSDLSAPEVRSGFEQTKRLILQAHQTVDPRFMVIIIPFREQILYSDTEFQAIFDASSNELTEFCLQNDIPIIDLTALVRKEAQHQAKEMYFEDNHLTERGNEIVAEILYRELNK